MTVPTLSAPAPAKINLTLEVTGRRDDGYHSLVTILQTLSLADEVGVRLDALRSAVSVSGDFAAGTPTDESNLAWRAAEELARLTGSTCDNLAISINKRIPPAGGLGGGASDAATTLRLLQAPWRATQAQLIAAANAVGSDEAALVLGGRVLATGRGDVVRRLPVGPPLGVVLFVPPMHLEGKTGRLFQALGAIEPDSDAATAAALKDPGRPWAGEDVFNSFERVAFDVFAGLDILQAELETRIDSTVRLAGAGPTLFWIGPLALRDLVAARAQGTDCVIIPTETANSLWLQS